jgi:hypothetical protein
MGLGDGLGEGEADGRRDGLLDPEGLGLLAGLRDCDALTADGDGLRLAGVRGELGTQPGL